MKVTLQFPGNVITSTTVAADGKSVLSIELTPQFAGRADLADLATIEVVNDHGKVLDSSLLKVSGASGKLGRKGREPVKAIADMTDEERSALKTKDKKRERREKDHGVGRDAQPVVAQSEASPPPRRPESAPRNSAASGK